MPRDGIIVRERKGRSSYARDANKRREKYILCGRKLVIVIAELHKSFHLVCIYDIDTSIILITFNNFNYTLAFSYKVVRFSII